jgi:DNA repair photolyase
MNNMYRQSVGSWNPFVGCKFDCEYCKSSYKRQAKRRKRQCLKCYDFRPHFHVERLKRPLPRTRDDSFIFCCDFADLAFCKPEWLQQILERIKELPDRTFLLQSKNPSVFMNYSFPSNVLLGTTIETNRDTFYKGISRAPLPSQRYEAMLKLRHLQKIVTIEPIIDFDIEILVNWICTLEPEACYVGYDSKSNYLPEPELKKVKVLITKIKSTTIVRPKLLRKAWWED